MSIPYQLIRSRRKTIQLVVNADGELLIRAPLDCSLSQIEDCIRQKEAWIVANQAIQRQRKADKPEFRLEDGAVFPWEGGTLTVRLCDVPLAIDFHGTLMLPKEAPVTEARAWLLARAQELLTPRVQAWATYTGLYPTAIAYALQRKRWGSMRSDGHLRLNAALLLCPPEYADYVIVHELAHIRYQNHSPAFHNLVRSFLPNADELRQQTRVTHPQVDAFLASDEA